MNNNDVPSVLSYFAFSSEALANEWEFITDIDIVKERLSNAKQPFLYSSLISSLPDSWLPVVGAHVMHGDLIIMKDIETEKYFPVFLCLTIDGWNYSVYCTRKFNTLDEVLDYLDANCFEPSGHKLLRVVGTQREIISKYILDFEKRAINDIVRIEGDKLVCSENIVRW